MHALVTLFTPLVTSHVLTASDKDASFMKASGIAAEALSNIRTVAALGLQRTLDRTFNAALSEGASDASKAHWAGTVA